jgi:cell division protein FtsW
VRKSALFLFGLVVASLVALGLIVLSSASEANAVRLHHGDAYFFLKRQLVYLGAGLVVATIAALVDYRWWRDHMVLTWLLAAVVLVLLCGVFHFRAVNGSHRWLVVGPLRLQPSEFAKFTIVILLAAWLDRLGWKVELFKKGALCSAAMIGLFAAPILLEPDFGSVMVVGLAGLLVMFVSGVRLLHMLPFFGAGFAVVAFKVATNANRMARIAAFFGISLKDSGVSDAAADRAAYQANQALAAIGNSNVWGAGLGESMQKYLYLPEAHTDFIFAIGAEELGIVFSVGVVLLFCAFFALSVYIARKASDRFGRLLVVGLAFIVFFQAMFNVGVVCKALPTKGMALPFFSYGGTNLLATFFCVGTILSVGIHSYRDRRRAFVSKVVVNRGRR